MTMTNTPTNADPGGQQIYMVLDDYDGSSTPAVIPCASLEAARRVAQGLCDEAYNDRLEVSCQPEDERWPRTTIPANWTGESIEYDNECWLSCVAAPLQS